jgi:DNA modification methylase
MQALQPITQKQTFFETSRLQLYQGNCLEILQSLKSGSIDCCVTSPPYFNLRYYDTVAQVWGGDPECNHTWQKSEYYREGGSSGGKVDGISERFLAQGKSNAQRVKATRWKIDYRCSACGAWQGELGQEPTIEEYIAHLGLIFEEVYRVLHHTGTCWINIGDSYASSTKCSVHRIREKSLCLVPQRLAISLQEMGWVVRQEIIWQKPCPMPESVIDRSTRSHEQIWMLTKESKGYYYNAEAIREKCVSNYSSGNGFKRSARQSYANSNGTPRGRDSPWQPAQYRNSRDVWTLGAERNSSNHYASFPSEIPRRCIQVGCRPQGIVLDPFAGTGTTALAAIESGRKAIAIELNTNYCNIITQRCGQQFLNLEAN